MDGESSRYDKLESMSQDGSSEPHNLPLEYLRNITNNFSEERILGEGGFGTVYKGVLPNGKTIAVKKLNSSSPGVKDRHFENEASHLTRLKHPNVVLLVGWCSETENIYLQYNGKYICAEKSERLLCLEYMPKGSLRGYLSDEASGLGWDTRYKIIEGICYGLHYLHEEWQHSTPIIHMDLKPANILLDDNMVPKIADFGLSRLFSEEKTWTCTINRDGTLGYMAPEYINRGLITTKSDIFSLGVIIIEIVTGHRDYPDENGVSPQEFIGHVLKKWTNRLQQTASYKDLYYYQQIRRCIQIGLVCVDLDRSKRPTTSQIIKLLHVESVDLSGRKRGNHLCFNDQRAPYLLNSCGIYPVDSPLFGQQRYSARGTNTTMQRNHPRANISKKPAQSCEPVAGGAPFTICYNCYKVLQIPKKQSLSGKEYKLRCGSCSHAILVKLDGNRLDVSEFAVSTHLSGGQENNMRTNEH